MKKDLKITYDKVADAMYIYLNDRKIKCTKEISNLVFVDIDVKNKPVGIEILDVSHTLGKGVFNLKKTKTDYSNLKIPIEILSGYSKRKVFA
jgi:uncharacterized protein YuzE